MKQHTTGKKAPGAPAGAGYQKRREITVDDITVDILRRYGSGNLSAGVRKAAGLVATLEAAAGFKKPRY